MHFSSETSGLNSKAGLNNRILLYFIEMHFMSRFMKSLQFSLGKTLLGNVFKLGL